MPVELDGPFDAKDCTHHRVHFGSGDYYLFCQGCGAKWVRADGLDQAAPGLSNRGTGSSLSGQPREKPP